MLLALYLAGAMFATRYLRTVGDMSLFWPSAGLGLAMVIRYGLRQAWVAPAAILLLHLAWHPVPAAYLPWSMASNLLGVLAGGAYLLRRQRRFTRRVHDGFLLLRGGLVLSLVSATVGTCGQLAAGMVDGDAAARIFGQWVLGDLLGVSVAGPISLLVLGDGARPGFSSRGWSGGEATRNERRAWGLLLAASLATLLLAASHGSVYALALTSVPLALLLWSAMRFPVAITMLATAATTMLVAGIVAGGAWGLPRPPSALDAALLMLLLIVLSLIPILLQSANYERRMAANALHERVTRDPLTGLLNRDSFERRARERLWLRTGPCVLLYLNLDHFTLVNGVGTHAAGDELLRRTARLVAALASDGGLAARIGSDEFAVLLPQSQSAAQPNVRRLLQQIEAMRIAWNEQTIIATASAGLVATHAPSASFDTLLSQADAACALAKRLGGNQLQVLEIDAVAHADGRAMDSALQVREAIEQRRFELHAQPIVDLRAPEAAPTHYEILLRWLDRPAVAHGSANLVEVAERYRLGPRLDREVLDEVLAWLSRDPASLPPELRFSVNIGGASLVDEEFANFLQARLARSGVRPDRLCLEITETNAVRDFERARGFIARMRALGCRFALDDFGTGFCSFTYLRELDVDHIKIDGSFVRELGRSAMADAVVRSINDVAHALGRLTVAEQIETGEQLARLRALGIDHGQGYALGAPAPLTPIGGADADGRHSGVATSPAARPWISSRAPG